MPEWSFTELLAPLYCCSTVFPICHFVAWLNTWRSVQPCLFWINPIFVQLHIFPGKAFLTAGDYSTNCKSFHEMDIWLEGAIKTDIFMKNIVDYYLNHWECQGKKASVSVWLNSNAKSIKLYSSTDSDSLVPQLWPWWCHCLGPFV